MAAFGPLDGVPGASNFPTLDSRNLHPVLDFDDTTDETVYFEGVLPPNYAGGGLTAKLYWMATSATANTCRWQLGVERIDTATDLDSDSFATSNSTGDATSGTSGIVTVSTITFTSGAQMDSLAAGEPFRLKLNRDADATSGTDSLVGDAEMLRLVLLET